jgi:hypothetical protein
MREQLDLPACGVRLEPRAHLHTPAGESLQSEHERTASFTDASAAWHAPSRRSRRPLYAIELPAIADESALSRRDRRPLVQTDGA